MFRKGRTTGLAQGTAYRHLIYIISIAKGASNYPDQAELVPGETLHDHTASEAEGGGAVYNLDA